MRKHVPLWVDLLTCLSIIGAGTLFIFDSYRSRVTEVDVALIKGTQNFMSLLISNTGGVDVAIKEARVLVPEFDIDNKINIDRLGTLIKRGDSKIIKSSNSRLNESVVYDKLSNDLQPFEIKGLTTKISTTPCIIKLTLVNSKGRLIQKEVTAECVAACYPDEFSS